MTCAGISSLVVSKVYQYKGYIFRYMSIQIEYADLFWVSSLDSSEDVAGFMV